MPIFLAVENYVLAPKAADYAVFMREQDDDCYSCCIFTQ